MKQTRIIGFKRLQVAFSIVELVFQWGHTELVQAKVSKLVYSVEEPLSGKKVSQYFFLILINWTKVCILQKWAVERIWKKLSYNFSTELLYLYPPHCRKVWTFYLRKDHCIIYTNNVANYSKNSLGKWLVS